MDIRSKISNALTVLDDIGYADKVHSNDAESDIILKNQHLILESLFHLYNKLSEIEIKSQLRSSSLRPPE